MKVNLKTSAALAVVLAASSAFGEIFTVDKVATLDPNPSNLAITEVGNTTLAAARLLIASANTANTGGVLDFQQRFQGGTFPNSTSDNNGVDFANGVLNPLYVAPNGGPTGTGVMGTPIFSFYRLESTGTRSAPDPITGVTTNVDGGNNFDSNLNQGVNVISGGFSSRTAGPAVPNVGNQQLPGDGTSVTGMNPANLPTTTTSGGYIGITGTGSPATFVFNNPLSFFAITALPRGATRDSLLTLTLSDNTTVQVGGAQAVGTAAVFFAYNTLTSANPLLTISRAALTNPNAQGVNRYDDLAFIVATPEPTSLALLGLGGAGILGRRRRA